MGGRKKRQEIKTPHGKKRSRDSERLREREMKKGIPCRKSCVNIQCSLLI